MFTTNSFQRRVVLFGVLAAGCCLASLRAQQDAARPAEPAPPARVDTAAQYRDEVLPLLKKYCYDCHGNGQKKAEFAMDAYTTPEAISKDRPRWKTVLEYVHTSEMPPPEAKSQPSLEERERITHWIRQNLFPVDPNNPDPGRVTIRRLNRTEYSNTIRDLIGVDFEAADDFPADDLGYGFDTIGDVLSISPVLMEKYLAAASRILDEAVATEPEMNQIRHYQANLMEYGFNADGDDGDGWMPLSPLEEDGVGMRIPVSQGDYLIRAQAYSNIRRGNAEHLLLTVMLDNTVVAEWKVTERTKEAPGVYQARIGVPKGRHRITVLNRRLRGGDNELLMKNGRIGAEQPGNIMVKWVDIEGPLGNSVQRIAAKDLSLPGDSVLRPDGVRQIEKNGEVGHRFQVPEDGEQNIRIQSTAHQAGTEYAKLELRVDGQPVNTFEVKESDTLIPLQRQRLFSIRLLDRQPWVYEFKLPLTAGEHTISAALVNDFADLENANPNLRDRNLQIDHIELSTPGAAAPLPAMPAPIKALFDGVTARDRAAARTILQRFARRAWRRPVQPQELERIMGLYDLAQSHGDSFDVCLKVSMKAVLVSPQFLFRGEVQPQPDNPREVFPVSEFDLASRLSYFLWSTMPDEELLNLAEQGQLRAQMSQQVSRMLASPRSEALVRNFAGQWLEIRNLRSLAPDKKLYPTFDDGLRDAMARETELFFQHLLREDRSLLELLTADYSFVNERLAQHYGIEGVKGDEFRQVNVAGVHRGGILTQGSVLTLTSNPTRTSPVKRGKWVLENLLGTPPPPPPPDVPELAEAEEAKGTLREQMEQHRANASCAACHARMDPIGFGLENFDGVGMWREKEGEDAIDASGQLVSGQKFGGAVELQKLLAETRREEYLRCVADKMLTYALGRGVEYYDQPAIDRIVEQLKRNDLKFSALVLGVIDSVPFQQRRGDGDRLQAATASVEK